MELDQLRHVSKALLGSKHRLEISAAVAAAPDEEIYGRAIAERAGVADSQVWGELRRLEDAGLLERLPRSQGGGTSVRFQRRPSAYWEWIWEMAGDAGRPAAALERQLRAGESQRFEVRGSLFAPLQPWLMGNELTESRDAAMHTLRQVVSMLNSEGGTLLIGAIEEARYEGGPVDLGRLGDCPHIGAFLIVGLLDPTFTQHGWERWERRFRDLLAHAIEPRPSLFVHIGRTELAGKEVCEVTIKPPPADEAYFLHQNDQYVYYVREGPSSRALRGPELVRYWRERTHAETS